MEEADRRARRFVLGNELWNKMQRSYTKRRNRYLARGVNKKLAKAQRRFEQRHRNRVRLIRSTSALLLTNLATTGGPAMGGGNGINGHGAGAGGSRNNNHPVASALTRHGHESS